MPAPSKTSPLLAAATLAAAWAPCGPALAQTETGPATQTAPISQAPLTAPVPAGPLQGAEPSGKLVLLFDTGSAGLGARNDAILDQAARIYRESNVIIMVVVGGTDAVGSAAQNLLLSQQRANAVARGLLARGLPAERTQILAKGETNPAVPARRGVAEPQNRRVEIIWRE